MRQFYRFKAVGSWLLFILKYWAGLIIVFQLSRIIFFCFNYIETKSIGLVQVLLSAWYGLTMDVSMATYLMLPFILFVFLSIFFKPFRKAIVYQVYTGVILFIILFLLIVDLAMFNTWGFRLDATPLKYISHPREAWASIQHQPLLTILLALMLAVFIAFRVNNFFLRRSILKVDFTAPRLLTFFTLLILLGASIIPIRGGFQLAPINQSSVYFSSNYFTNQSALNGPWNLLYSLVRSTNKKENRYLQLPKQEAALLLDTLFKKNGGGEKLFSLDSSTKPNVIFIVWEGLTAKAIDLHHEGKPVTPYFNALKKEGIYFWNMYASGDRTDKGLVAVLSGYPANPSESILKVPLKAAKLPMLSKEFQKRNYNTSFYYGGETEFANMKAYLLQGGFDKIVSVDDFEDEELNSKWGAHDEVVMNRIVTDMASWSQPFFCTWLTLSSHEPFEVPVAPAFELRNELGQYLNSLHYTDSVFGAFIQNLKRSALWKNTIIVTIADHGSRMPKANFKADDFKIGAVILGGPVMNPKNVTAITSQVDIAGLISKELGFKDTSFPWSREVTDTSGLQWAFFTFNNGFGYAEPLGTMIYDNVGTRVVQKSGAAGSTQLHRGQALQQAIFQDYLDK